MELLLRVVAPHFVAGFVVVDGRVVEAAPILRYMIGWTDERAVRYALTKGWNVD